MRVVPAVLLASLASYPALCQTYTVSTFAGGGLPINMPGTAAKLFLPHVGAVDQAGNLYFAHENTVLRLDAATGRLTLAAGNGIIGSSRDTAPAAEANLAFPNSVAMDASGDLYIANTNDFTIREVSNGMMTTIAGTGWYGYTGDGGPATSAQLGTVYGIAVTAGGTLYIADSTNNCIRMVSGGVITTVAGTGTAGFSGDNGLATSAQLDFPSGVAVDSAGNLYIADTHNHRVRKVSTGVITTVAGNGSDVSGGGNGPATSTPVVYPGLYPPAKSVSNEKKEYSFAFLAASPSLRTLAGLKRPLAQNRLIHRASAGLSQVLPGLPPGVASGINQLQDFLTFSERSINRFRTCPIRPSGIAWSSRPT